MLSVERATDSPGNLLVLDAQSLPNEFPCSISYIDNESHSYYFGLGSSCNYQYTRNVWRWEEIFLGIGEDFVFSAWTFWNISCSPPFLSTPCAKAIKDKPSGS